MDTKTVENFSGAPGTWVDWSFKARALFGILDVGQGAVGGKMGEAEKTTEAADSSALTQDAQVATRVDYNVLAQVGWRVGGGSCETLSRTRARAMHACSAGSWRRIGSVSSWRSSPTRSTNGRRSSRGTRRSRGTMRVAIVLGNAPRYVRDSLRAQSGVIDNGWMKSVVQQILTSDSVYSVTGVVVGHGGIFAPSDIEAIRGTSTIVGSQVTWRRSAAPEPRAARMMAARAQARAAS